MAKLTVMASFVIISVLFGQFAGLTSASDALSPQRFDEKVNLALRRAGHHLLLASGDSTSRIPAVKKQKTNTFVLQLNKSFNYGRLPALLQESFHLHQINADYDVAVLDCETSELQLGYNYLDYTKNNEVPCGGRQQGLGCYTVQVTFSTPHHSTIPHAGLIWWALGTVGSIGLGVSYVLWRRKQTPIAHHPAPSKVAPATSLISFGNSGLDVDNQLLYSGKTKHNLTYREAKLLHLFIKHQNQVLERDFILKSVWEDEGVTVGRSIDVFVSRLRKLLQEDASLKIAAVHGVGYRLEVSNGNLA